MTIKLKKYWWGSSMTTTTESAIEQCITGGPGESAGQIEELESKVEQLTTVLSVLCGLLVDSGTINAKELFDKISYNWEVINEP